MLKRKIKVQREILGDLYKKELLSIGKFKSGKFITDGKTIDFQKVHLTLATSSLNMLNQKGEQIYFHNYGFSEKQEVELLITDERMRFCNIKTITRLDTGVILQIMY